MKLLLATLMGLMSSTMNHAHGSDHVDPDVAQIHSVIEAFRTAILDKDLGRFQALFLHGTVTWQSVRSDERLQRERELQPMAPKVPIDSAKTHLSFIHDIVDNSEPIEEKFRNVQVETDGDIATVMADYSFHRGEVESNHGKESWHLVRTDAGWKIASVIWSVNSSPTAAESDPRRGRIAPDASAGESLPASVAR